MPTNESGRTVNTMHYSESTDQGKTWKNNSYASWEIYESSFTWPVTIRRAFPSNLFNAGTARITSSVKTRDSGFDTLIDNKSIWERGINRSVLSMYREPTVTIPIESIDDALVYNKIRADLRGKATNLAQMLAEYAQTAKLFRDLAEVVTSKGRSLLRRYPRGSFAGTAKKYSQSASDAYLAWTYGISPLCDDMNGAMRDLYNAANAKPLVIRGVESRSVTGTIGGLISPSSTVFLTKGEYGRIRKIRNRYQWQASMNKNALLSTIFAHGFGNPLSVGYELVPFSFVVDWWVNVGEVLASLDNLVLCDKLLVAKSTTERRFYFVQASGDMVIRPGSGARLTRTDTRRAPVEISRVSTLKYDPSVSWKHIANGLALLNSLRK